MIALALNLVLFLLFLFSFILGEKERRRHGMKSLYSSRVIDIRSDIIGVDALIKLFHGEVDFSYSCVVFSSHALESIVAIT